MKNILITGGAGFIGFSIVKKLLKLKKFKITIVDKCKINKIDDEFKNIILNNKNIKFINKTIEKFQPGKIIYHYIFHAAAKLGVNNVNKDPFDTIKNNSLPIFKIINIAKNKTKIIFFSTSEVYSPLISRGYAKFPLEEDRDLLINSMPLGRDSYYLSKLFCEKVLQLQYKKFLILRPHNIYGPRMGNSHVIPNLINKFNNNLKTINIYSPNHTRAFCYIDDAINQIIKLSFSKKCINQVFNIGNNNEEIQIIDLAKKIKFLLKSNKKILKGYVTLGSPKRRVPSMKKNFKFIKYKNKSDLKNGLLKTIKWYQRL
jgi:nucleoside-diphosphate-sugar epimerase